MQSRVLESFSEGLFAPKVWIQLLHSFRECCSTHKDRKDRTIFWRKEYPYLQKPLLSTSLTENLHGLTVFFLSQIHGLVICSASSGVLHHMSNGPQRAVSLPGESQSDLLHYIAFSLLWPFWKIRHVVNFLPPKWSSLKFFIIISYQAWCSKMGWYMCQGDRVFVSFN